MRTRPFTTIQDIEPVLPLVVEVVDLVFLVRQDRVRGRRPEERAACVQVALPVLLHHSVHYLSLHDLKRIKVFQVVQRLPAHHVYLADLELHLLREEQVIEHSACLALHLLGECVSAQTCHRVTALNLVEEHHEVACCLYRVHVAQEVLVAPIVLDLCEPLLHRRQQSVHLFVFHLKVQLHQEENLRFEQVWPLLEGRDADVDDWVNEFLADEDFFIRVPNAERYCDLFHFQALFKGCKDELGCVLLVEREVLEHAEE